MLKAKITCAHPSQTWTMFRSIYGRPLWPYGRSGVALDRSTTPPPLERYVRQREDGWNILEKRRCVEGKNLMPAHKPDLDDVSFDLRTPPWSHGRLGLALDRSTSPPPLERYVRQCGGGWNTLEKRWCVEGKNHMPTPKPDLDDVSFDLQTPPMAI